MQGTWVWSLVWEDPTSRGTTKPMCHSHWACAREPGSCSYWAREPQSPGSSRRRSHHNSKRAGHNEGQPALAAAGESPHKAMKAQHGQNKQINKKCFKLERKTNFSIMFHVNWNPGDTAGGLRSIQTRVLPRQRFCVRSELNNYRVSCEGFLNISDIKSRLSMRGFRRYFSRTGLVHTWLNKSAFASGSWNRGGWCWLVPWLASSVAWFASRIRSPGGLSDHKLQCGGREGLFLLWTESQWGIHMGQPGCKAPCEGLQVQWGLDRSASVWLEKCKVLWTLWSVQGSLTPSCTPFLREESGGRGGALGWWGVVLLAGTAKAKGKTEVRSLRCWNRSGCHRWRCVQPKRTPSWRRHRGCEQEVRGGPKGCKVEAGISWLVPRAACRTG